MATAYDIDGRRNQARRGRRSSLGHLAVRTGPACSRAPMSTRTVPRRSCGSGAEMAEVTRISEWLDAPAPVLHRPSGFAQLVIGRRTMSTSWRRWCDGLCASLEDRSDDERAAVAVHRTDDSQSDHRHSSFNGRLVGVFRIAHHRLVARKWVLGTDPCTLPGGVWAHSRSCGPLL